MANFRTILIVMSLCQCVTMLQRRRGIFRPYPNCFTLSVGLRKFLNCIIIVKMLSCKFLFDYIDTHIMYLCSIKLFRANWRPMAGSSTKPIRSIRSFLSKVCQTRAHNVHSESYTPSNVHAPCIRQFYELHKL